MSLRPVEILNFLKIHAYHFVFAVSILSLASLVGWWSIFIHNSIQKQRLQHYEILQSELKYYALKLGLDKSHSPKIGIWEKDPRFEVVFCSPNADLFSIRLDPYWPDFCLRIRQAVFQKIEKESGQLNFMLVGESGVLILVVFISSLFLYRFIQLERRTTKEVKEFWERSAHEIKTPISGIKAFLQNLKSKCFNHEEMDPYLNMALKQVRRQEQLAENIFSAYSYNTKKAKLKLVNINLTFFLIEYFKKDSLHLADAVVNLDFDKYREVRARVDVQPLKVILDNITDNAVRYASPGLVLTVKVATERKKAVITIEDNGPGFEPHLSEKLFQAYRLLKAELPDGKHGAGMGLYISRRLARNMGGDLKARSGGEGKGAEFQIFLNLG